MDGQSVSAVFSKLVTLNDLSAVILVCKLWNSKGMVFLLQHVRARFCGSYRQGSTLKGPAFSFTLHEDRTFTYQCRETVPGGLRDTTAWGMYKQLGQGANIVLRGTCMMSSSPPPTLLGYVVSQLKQEDFVLEVALEHFKRGL